MYRKIDKCRVCGNEDLASVLSLGVQVLTGVFPKNKSQEITQGPLELVKCQTHANGNFCGLLQLAHSFDLKELYGDNYGYRSSLNQSMVRHLHGKVAKILDMIDLAPGDVVLDIGSNDSTLLQAYPNRENLVLIGMDPTGQKFRKYYPDHIRLVSNFFSAEAFRNTVGHKKAKIVTSIAMLYDLESPMNFLREVYDILADDGLWTFEQSYLPTMLQVNAYDTICHEHLEYYGLHQIKWMADKVGFKIVKVSINDVNGGSFSVTVAKRNAPYSEDPMALNLLDQEQRDGLDTLRPYREFKSRVLEHKGKLQQFLRKTKAKGKTILGYGASTKGNVILQYCEIAEKDMPFIAEVNEDKFGSYTPGTGIPIISEVDARAMSPDYFLVLPWHFKKVILEREREFLANGGKLVLPLPDIEVVGLPAEMIAEVPPINTSRQFS